MLRFDEAEPVKLFVADIEATVPLRVRVFAPMESLPAVKVAAPAITRSLPKVAVPVEVLFIVKAAILFEVPVLVWSK